MAHDLPHSKLDSGVTTHDISHPQVDYRLMANDLSDFKVGCEVTTHDLSHPK